MRPLVASHGTAEGYLPSFAWAGTRDPSAALAVPAALAFFGEVGWQAVREHNNELALQGARLVARRIGTDPPDDTELAAAMRLVPLLVPLSEAQARALERRLLAQHGVGRPTTFHGARRRA